jgi:pimeloyl-ACP methyl ester carboxylesterase
MNLPATQFLTAPDGAKLAYRASPGAGPTIVWLGGFKSDMTGTKAAHLHAWAAETGRAFLRFDYFGHGESVGDFALGTISRWRADALMAIDRLTEGPLVLVGSSMGGWLSLLCAQARPDRVKGLVLIAPAADFTETLMAPHLPAEAKAALAATGRWERPSAYGDGPYVITQALLDDGARWSVLDAGVAFAGPVRILHGQDDPDVPWRHGLRTADAVSSGDVVFTLVKGGDHRLSSPDDLARLITAVEEVSARA